MRVSHTPLERILRRFAVGGRAPNPPAAAPETFRARTVRAPTSVCTRCARARRVCVRQPPSGHTTSSMPSAGGRRATPQWPRHAGMAPVVPEPPVPALLPLVREGIGGSLHATTYGVALRSQTGAHYPAFSAERSALVSVSLAVRAVLLPRALPVTSWLPSMLIVASS